MIRHHCSLLRPVALAVLAACFPSVQAQDAAATQVVVSGSAAPRAADLVPFAIGVVDRDTISAAGPGINLSEAIGRVPGIVVNNRSNYAQDLQISARGFGARAGFGVRGIRLYTDGIPASGPDGQGQVSQFDLVNAQRIEVLRGPFSALYGNSSGGVISLFSAPVKGPEADFSVDGGSDGLRQVRASVGALTSAGIGVRASLTQMTLDGFRPQSAANRTLGTLRGAWEEGNDRVVLQLNHLRQNAQDALGLNRADFNADPYQTTQVAIDFNTRKELAQTQVGGSWTHRFDAGALREASLAGYSGQRSVTQWQAIPVAAQGSPRHGGGVVDFDRGFHGAEARLRWGWDALDLVVGAALDSQRDDRRGYENFIGSTLGVTGRLRRDEVDRADTRDVFAQADWQLNPTLALSAGLRHGKVSLSADDAYLANGDDSGEVRYTYTNPVLGLRWQVAPGWQLHASVARGVEAPTLGELAYRPDGQGGFNTALKAQTSRQAELGARWRAQAWQLDATLFHTQVDDELSTATNSGGRSSFQNVGRTRRQGAELSAAWRPASGWRAATALTWLDATYLDAFKTCAGTPCTAPTADVAAGNRVAGAPRSTGFAELAWRDARWGEFGLEARGAGRVAVNDRNTDFAGGYGVLALRWRKAYTLPDGTRAELLARVDNLADRAYAGSVIVNDGNGRFFEPGAPRSVLLGLRLGLGR
ncbi:TonB-dependent receptor [Ideonella sp. 4Y16]|uniref:TonB-dependent receptor family protein n=1 Tax=Ideonella alba TaxID=2824118 RepID=UPI001B37A0F2|nr:TonB-dependent receptor [Ideonella alba]MBQ0943623.1 TonB-dependent receptor [Ideonella alba]